MREHDMARAFAADRGPAASIGELLAMAAFSAPCCGHIALCDGACHDGCADDRRDRPQDRGLGDGGLRGGKPAGWRR